MSIKSNVSPESTALIVVDVQNDFCSRDGNLGKQGADLSMVDEMVPNLIELIANAKMNKVPVIYIQTFHEAATDSITWKSRGVSSGAEPNICRPGTCGAEFYEVAPQDDDIIVNKHRYSAFLNTRLDTVLRTLKVETLIMTGVATNVCVESTARDGFMRDYNIVFLEDCTASYSREAHEMTLKNISGFFGEVANSKELANVWESIKAIPIKVEI
ncbi:peroxyureidoacrylate/ureidoacrylate amidohydrolase RutB [Lysinibacillus sp. PLM2]|nr:peroxyureidoacrylate/ureidoacrylate amidohydrolase RutB [Lysinibacillus sp. PLM2]